MQSSVVFPISTNPRAWTSPCYTITTNLNAATKLRRLPPALVVAGSTSRPELTDSTLLEKKEVFKSMESWASQWVLPLLKPTDKCWQPSDFLPKSSEPLDEFTDQVRALRERTVGLTDEHFVVLVGNMLTEDALPGFLSPLHRLDELRDDTGSSLNPWVTWTKGWTSEENRHGDLLKTYLYLSGRVNMLMIEKTLQNLIDAGKDNGYAKNPYTGYVYTAFQERAASVSHGNMARAAKEGGDNVLAKICGTIASDEKRHEMAYTRIVEKLVEVDPNEAMLAISEIMRAKIKMPGHLMYDGRDANLYAHYSAVAQRHKIYTASDYADILEFFIGKWRLEKLEGLTGEGKHEQEFVCGLPVRIRKLQERADERAKKLEPRGVKFSWIFDKEVNF